MDYQLSINQSDFSIQHVSIIKQNNKLKRPIHTYTSRLNTFNSMLYTVSEVEKVILFYLEN